MLLNLFALRCLYNLCGTAECSYFVVTKISNLSMMHAKRPPNICYYHLIKAHIGRRIYTLRYTTFMESCMPLCTKTACIFSMVTGWQSARALLYKPSKALALKLLQHRGICSYFKPAVIQLFTSKKHDLQKKNKAFMVCQNQFIDSFGRKDRKHFFLEFVIYFQVSLLTSLKYISR